MKGGLFLFSNCENFADICFQFPALISTEFALLVHVDHIREPGQRLDSGQTHFWYPVLVVVLLREVLLGVVPRVLGVPGVARLLVLLVPVLGVVLLRGVVLSAGGVGGVVVGEGGHAWELTLLL